MRDPTFFHCPPHVRGEALRGRITAIVTTHPGTRECTAPWFSEVYELLNEAGVHDPARNQFYQHALDIEANLTPKDTECSPSLT